MAKLYADEGFPRDTSVQLRALGNDVLTVQEAGKDNQGIPDDQVLAYAISLKRAVLTINRIDFIRLHRCNSQHRGIIVCTEDADFERLANRIHAVTLSEGLLIGKLVRVNRPAN